MDKTFIEEALNLFRYPSRIIIAGYTNSGKTHLCTKIVEKYEGVFSKIVICGVTSHPLQNNANIKEKLEIHEEIIDPAVETTPYTDPRAQSLLILDDNFLSSASSQTVVNSFIKGRHKNLSVILITQNIFFSGKVLQNHCLEHLPLHSHEKQRYLPSAVLRETDLWARARETVCGHL